MNRILGISDQWFSIGDSLVLTVLGQVQTSFRLWLNVIARLKLACSFRCFLRHSSCSWWSWLPITYLNIPTTWVCIKFCLSYIFSADLLLRENPNYFSCHKIFESFEWKLQVSFMPILVLAARLCPPGVEATLFATLMSISNGASVTGGFLGAGLTRLLGVTSNNFQNLALLVLLCNLSSLLPLPFLGLLPSETELQATVEKAEKALGSKKEW